jgi:DNA-nicking Smr family endonuclease
MGNLFSSTEEVENSTLSHNPGVFLQPGISDEAASLRYEASQLKLRAKDASKKSQSEYNFGSKAQAKVLSNRKKDLYKQTNEKNRQAAELIFEHFNQDRRNNVIDLHGLYVREALEYLQAKLDECRSEDILQLKVITGMGNNSPGNIAKIKPEVEKFVRQNRLKVTSYGGHVIIDLSTYNPYRANNSQDSDDCVIL